MTNLRPHNIFFILLFVAIGQSSFAQTTVKVTADRNSILIGEQVRLLFEADIPENEPIRFFQPDSIPHFEILRRDKIDTVNTSKGTRLSGAIYLTSFDSGHWVIPPVLLRDSIYTDSIPVDVGYTPFDVTKPYNDIKEIIEAKDEEKKDDKLWWYVGAGLLVLAIIFYLVFRKKTKPAEPKVMVEEDPYKAAIRQLDALAVSKPAKEQYYSQLVDIFRVYVLKRKGIESMQQTTGDLVSRLRSAGLVTANYAELAAALELSDLVKFARFDASGEEDRQSLITIRNSIEIIEQDKEKPA